MEPKPSSDTSGQKPSSPEEIDKALFDHLKEHTNNAFAKMTTYSNLIIIAGYVTYFSIWNFSRPFLPGKLALWAGLFMLLSALCFVGFEIFKMVSFAVVSKRLGNVLKNEDMGYTERMKRYSLAATDFELSFSRVWIGFLIPTLLFATAGAVILLGQLITGILR